MEYRIVEYSETHRNKVSSLLDITNRDGGVAASELIKAFSTSPERHISTKLAILADDKIIGLASMWKTSPSADTVNIGYEVDPEYRQKGIARSLCDAAIHEARLVGVKEVYALMDPENDASIGVAKSLGFIPTTNITPKDQVGFMKILS